MKIKKYLLEIFITQIIICTFFAHSYALNPHTHEDLNRYIANNTIDGFSLDSYLKDQLGFPNGKDESFNSKRIWAWLRDGGKYEDKPPGTIPYLRSFNHYHNPLTDQGYSGFPGTESSIQWSQRSSGTQNPGGHYSWHDVRDYFYDALIATDKTTRENNFADIFRGLGQLMHLVQDLSVPAHTRDDVHLMYNFETWVRNNIRYGYIPNYPPIPFDQSAIGKTNQLASVPVANLFDTNQFDGTNPEITLRSDIGLSEYANANFLSSDTMFTSGFPFPKVENCILYRDEFNDRQYLRSNGNGEIVDHLAITSWLYFWRWRYFPQADSYWPVGLDPVCYEDYASLLIPRTVGYSAALLDYFFRGKVQVTSLPLFFNNGMYALFLDIKNITPSQETMSDGYFSLIVRYTPSGGNPDGSDDIFIRAYENIASGTILYNDEKTDVRFNLPVYIPIENYDSIKCILTFRGTLGNESDAVIGKSFSLGEIKFSEEWDNGLVGNHPWIHTTPDQNPDNGSTSNIVDNVYLIKDNIRYIGYKTPRFNSSYLDFVNINNPNGLPITPNTYLQFKINELSINEQPPAPAGSTAAYQYLNFEFNNGLALQFTQEGQGVYWNPTTGYYTFSLGFIIVTNIYTLFQNYGITIPESLYLEEIRLTQQLLSIGEPSTVEHHQHMEVDFIRVVEEYKEQE